MVRGLFFVSTPPPQILLSQNEVHPPPSSLWEPTSLQTEGGQTSYLGFIMVFEEPGTARRNNYQAIRQWKLHNQYGDVLRLHLLNKHCGFCFLGARIQSRRVLFCPSFIILLPFLPNVFMLNLFVIFSKKKKKPDRPTKTCNFSAGSRAARFCVQGNLCVCTGSRALRQPALAKHPYVPPTRLEARLLCFSSPVAGLHAN